MKIADIKIEVHCYDLRQCSQLDIDRYNSFIAQRIREFEAGGKLSPPPNGYVLWAPSVRHLKVYKSKGRLVSCHRSSVSSATIFGRLAEAVAVNNYFDGRYTIQPFYTPPWESKKQIA
jgi:hypothetical protein